MTTPLTSDPGEGHLKAVGELRPGDRSEGIYDAWAETYDGNLLDDYGYVAPQLSVAAFDEENQDGTDLSIIDYACGTGLVGVELTKRGYTQIDGLDVSTGMLAEARKKNVYTKLFTGDMTSTLDVADATYDVAFCIGAFNYGHLGPENIDEILRTVKPHGLIVLYMNAVRYMDQGYETYIKALENTGKWRILKTEQANYMSAINRPGQLIMARRS